MNVLRVVFFAVFCVTLSACAEKDGAAPVGEVFTSVDSPAASPSGQPRLVATDDGLLMSWVERTEGEAALRYSWYRGGEWGEAQTAATGDDWFVNWADTPGVVPLADGRLLAFYLQRTGPQPYAYGIRVITSHGDGEWSDPIIPHATNLPTEYGFVSVLREDDGSARLVWLDGADMYDPDASDAHAGHGSSGAMTLRTAVLTPDGRIEDDILLDDHTCECCPTAATSTSSGALVAYRDRSREEVRDIAVVRLSESGATEPTIPSPDNWTISGCPVNGPAIVSSGERLALSWFTGVEGGAVQVAFSDDAGATFAPANRIDDGNPIGRVDAAMLDDGSVVVLWIEGAQGGGELRVRRIEGSGVMQPSLPVSTVRTDRATGMPRLALFDGYVWAAWVDVESGTVRTARVSADGLP